MLIAEKGKKKMEKIIKFFNENPLIYFIFTTAFICWVFWETMQERQPTEAYFRELERQLHYTYETTWVRQIESLKYRQSILEYRQSILTDKIDRLTEKSGNVLYIDK